MLDGFVRSQSGLGSENRTFYVWNTKDGWFCQTGCFFDTEGVFISAITKKYSSDHKYIKALKLLKED